MTFYRKDLRQIFYLAPPDLILSLYYHKNTFPLEASAIAKIDIRWRSESMSPCIALSINDFMYSHTYRQCYQRILVRSNQTNPLSVLAETSHHLQAITLQ